LPQKRQRKASSLTQKRGGCPQGKRVKKAPSERPVLGREKIGKKRRRGSGGEEEIGVSGVPPRGKIQEDKREKNACKKMGKK